MKQIKIKNIKVEDISRLRAALLDSNTHLTRLRHAAVKGASALALTFALACDGQAQTTVCGAIASQTWTKANSPYLVTCDLTVSTLTIQPGVQVIFQGNYVMEVQGWLKANGTTAEPIVFIRTNGGWQGIYFNQSLPASQLSHCTILGGVNSGVRIRGASATINDCTIANCRTDQHGGGVSVDNGSQPDGNVTLQRCVITNNSALFSGGGVHGLMGTNTLSLIDCVINGNSVNPSLANGNYYGGGLSVYNGDLSVQGCTFLNNTCRSRKDGTTRLAAGGGIYFQLGTARVKNSLLRGNLVYAHDGDWGGAARAVGGGFCVGSGTLHMTNCVVADNTAWGFNQSLGAGVWIEQGTADVVNCSVARNQGIEHYAGFTYVDGTGVGGANANCAQLLNCIVFFNTGATAQILRAGGVTYSCVENGYSGTGNIRFNPVFTAASAGDFHLLDGSPCIDAGDPSAAFNDACFPPSFGPPQGYAVRNDMGAYGGPGACGFMSGTSPQIASQPNSQSSCLGQRASFSVVVNGTPPFSYQWYRGATLLSGQTASTLTLTNLQPADAGAYQAVVWNAYGTTNSTPAVLVVNDACVDLCMYAGLNIAGLPGRTYELRYTTDLSNTNFATWTFLATNTTPWFYIDTGSCGSPKRFYGVKLLP